MRTDSRVHLGPYRTPEQRRAALLVAADKRRKRATRKFVTVWAVAGLISIASWLIGIAVIAAALKWAIH